MNSLSVARLTLVLISSTALGRLPLPRQEQPVIRPRVTPVAPTEVANVPAIGACEWTDLVVFDWIGGDLSIETRLRGDAPQMIRDGRQSLLRIGGGGRPYLATTVWERFASLPVEDRKTLKLPPDGSVLNIIAVEAPDDPPAQLPRVRQLKIDPDGVLISCRGMVGKELLQIDVVSDTDGVMFVVASQSDPLSTANFTHRASSAAALLAEHEWDVRHYLSLALRPLAGGDPFLPGAGDVYEAFDFVAPTDDARERLNVLLARLGAPDEIARASAAKSLRDSPDEIVCAAIRQPRSGLSPSQRGALDDFVASRSRRIRTSGTTSMTATARGVRSDRLFLIDCLEFSDPRVRAAAMADLSKQLNRPIRLDPQDSHACAAEALQLRAEFLQASRTNK